MKKVIIGFLLPLSALVACKQSTSDLATTTLRASSTSINVGETVTVSASTGANAVSWTVTPDVNALKTYSVTTEKTNYITFKKAGEYRVGIRAANLELDSIHHCNHEDSLGHHFEDSVWNHSIDSIWHHHGHDRGDCQNGRDSASVLIKVQ